MSEILPKTNLYRIPFSWKSYVIMHIEAVSLKEARKIADQDPLPDAEYIDGSFTIDEEMLEFFLHEDGHPEKTIYTSDEEAIE